MKEFETFAIRGNAIDLAIGMVIGAAFNQITTSLATNVITPPIGLLFGGFDFVKLSLPLGGNSVIAYGIFLQAILNFVINCVRAVPAREASKSHYEKAKTRGEKAG